ncbi:hypothetical protein ILP97_33375 [Amycolatopsis sp. H6(2020)]|nr:hypothetical protein [Amycolatopsis sp. H6(2020)]
MRSAPVIFAGLRGSHRNPEFGDLLAGVEKEDTAQVPLDAFAVFTGAVRES